LMQAILTGPPCPACAAWMVFMTSSHQIMK
jgi:hypothetical protein